MFRACLLVVVVAAAQANILDDAKSLANVASDAASFFGKDFNYKNLYADKPEDLLKNIGRVKDLFTIIGSKINILKPAANDQQKEALDQVPQMSEEVNNFEKNKANDDSKSFESKKTEWAQLAEKLFTVQNLNSVVTLLQGKVPSISAGSSLAPVIALVVPAVLFAVRH